MAYTYVYYARIRGGEASGKRMRSFLYIYVIFFFPFLFSPLLFHFFFLSLFFFFSSFSRQAAAAVAEVREFLLI